LNIAILHSAFVESGGAERVILNEASYLRSRGHGVACYGSIIDYEKCYPGALKSIDVRPYILNLPLPKLRLLITLPMSLVAASAISRQLRDFDVIICHHEPSPWVGYKAWRKFGVPYLCYMHHPPRFIYPRPVERQLGWGHNYDRRLIDFVGNRTRIVKKIDSVAVLEARGILANSARTSSEIMQVYGRRSTVCYPGVNLWRAREGGGSNKALMGEHGIDGPFVVSVGRHTPHKRLDWLLMIFSRVAKAFPELDLVIAGEFHPTYTPRLEQIARKMGISDRTKFLGHVPDQLLSILYAESLVCLYTAANEDFGMIPVEAMSCGAPVVAWEGDGPSETINERVGFKAKAYDLSDFVRKTVTLLSEDSLREEMSQNAIRYARENFSWERHVDILENKIQLISG